MSFPACSFPSLPACPIQSCLALFCSFMSHPTLFCPYLFHPVLSCPVLSSPALQGSILFHLFLSCPGLSQPILSISFLSHLAEAWLIPSCLAWFCLRLSHTTVLFCHMSSHPVLGCPGKWSTVLSCPVLSQPDLHCYVQSHPVLKCPKLFGPAWYCTILCSPVLSYSILPLLCPVSSPSRFPITAMPFPLFTSCVWTWNMTIWFMFVFVLSHWCVFICKPNSLCLYQI